VTATELALVLSIAAFPASIPQSALAAEAAVERFAVVSSGRVIGATEVTTRGDVVDVDLRIDSNGRGEKQREHVELGADGVPLRWTVEGVRNAGAPVKESFERTAELARWSTLDDHGQASQPGPTLYLPNDGSTWAMGLYLKLLRAAPGQRLATLPAGELRVEKVRDVRVGGASPVEATVWAIWGMGLTPSLVISRPDGHYLGFITAGYLVVEERLAADHQALSALAQELESELLARFTREWTHRYQPPVWLVDVRVFDPETGALGEKTNLVVFQDRVVGTRSGPPPPWAVVVDGQGGTVLPGLHDLHAHTSAWDGPLHLAAGVTSIRDPGNDNEALLDLTRRRDAGEVMGPRAARAGFLERKSPFSANTGFVVESLPEALDRVRWYSDHGYTGIKIYNSMTPDWVKPIAAESHRLGLRVSGHVPAFMTSERALRDGYDEISHINQLALSWIIGPTDDTRTPFRFTALGERMAGLDLASPPVRRTLEVMKARRATLDPTMAIFKGMLLSRPGRAAPGDEAWLVHMPASVQRGWRTAELDVKPGQDATYVASWRKLRELLKLLDQEGIALVPGTDSLPGIGLHSELQAWVESGLAPARVLSAATLRSARHLGLDPRLGLLRPGAPADLLLVPGDPTRDISALRKARLVMTRGATYFPEEIHRALGIEPFASRPPVTQPTGR
jgi:hypothetical protein